MKLEDLKSEQELKIINKDLVAVHKHTKEKIVANELGCEFLSSKITEIEDNKSKIKVLESQIKALKEINKENFTIIGDLYRLGFCDLTDVAFDRDKFTGIIKGEHPEHSEHCRNKKGGK